MPSLAGVPALIRTQTPCSERGRPRPHAYQGVCLRNSGLPCGLPDSHAATGRPPATPLPRDAHAPPPNGGFCTIRRTATACRRRVAPLMLQFPPFARGNHGPRGRQRRITGPRPAHPAANAGPHPATTRLYQPQPRPPGHAPPPARPATAHRPTPRRQRGFCTIRRIATACRRRVAPLMLQFPPLTTPSTASPAASDGQPGHGLGPASRPVPLAHPSSRTHYSDKTKSDQFSSFKLPQTNSQRTRIHA